jgi:fluoride ion exporter CrcB/FEX
MNLFRNDEMKYALINIFGTNLLGLLLVFAGFFLSKALLNAA